MPVREPAGWALATEGFPLVPPPRTRGWLPEVRVRNLGVAAAHDKVGSIRTRWEHAVNENVTIHAARGRGTKAVPERAALTSRRQAARACALKRAALGPRGARAGRHAKGLSN